MKKPNLRVGPSQPTTPKPITSLCNKSQTQLRSLNVPLTLHLPAPRAWGRLGPRFVHLGQTHGHQFGWPRGLKGPQPSTAARDIPPARSLSRCRTDVRFCPALRSSLCNSHLLAWRPSGFTTREAAMVPRTGETTADEKVLFPFTLPGLWWRLWLRWFWWHGRRPQPPDSFSTEDQPWA